LNDPRGSGEDHRQRVIRLKLARMENRPALTIATGFRALDDALGTAGLPRGRIVEIFGPPDCGKTTLALQIAGHSLRRRLSAVWMDAEGTYDPAYAADLGVPVEELPVIRPDSAESAMSMLNELARSAAVDLIVVDSAAALVPSLEMEAAIGGQSPGLQARVLASGLRTLARFAANGAVSTVFLNQARVRKDRSGEESETSACGPALKLHAAIRIALHPSGPHETGFRILKNKVAGAFATGRLTHAAGRGFLESP